MRLSIVVAGLAAGTIAVKGEVPIGQLAARNGVEIAGTVRHVFGNEFVLEDATGSVLVDTGPEWFEQRRFSVGERLVVRGEMDDGDLDAFSITHADGTVTTIRPRSGPPPWAGGRGRHGD